MERAIIRAISALMAEGWERYAWWVRNDYLPRPFLDRLADMLIRLQFGWCRVLDGTTRGIHEAIELKMAG